MKDGRGKMEAEVSPTDRRLPFIAFLSVAVLAACTTTTQRPPSSQQTQPRALDQIARMLPGNYSNHLQWRQDGESDPGPYALTARLEPVAVPGTATFLLAQSEPDGAARHFALELAAGAQADHLEGLFLPLDAAQESRPNCRMHFTMVSAGFTGETDPRQCRFERDGHSIGLHKEIAFDGQQIVIADQLRDLAEGGPLGEPRVLRFFRERRFQGWAGVREGDDWRLSGELTLHSEGAEAVPLDAHGRSLGLRLQLARILWREDQPLILRLSVHEEASGKLLGYAWADPDATQLGINLPDVQAGLTALPE